MKFIEILKDVSPYSYIMILWKLRKSDLFLLNYEGHPIKNETFFIVWISVDALS